MPAAAVGSVLGAGGPGMVLDRGPGCVSVLGVGSEIAELAERDASGEVAGAYERLRGMLGVRFVPTLYRMLAVHGPYLVAAVELCGHLLAGGSAEQFAVKARAGAGGLRPDRRIEVTPAAAARVGAVAERYNRANPRSLLMVCALARSLPALPEVRVMRPGGRGTVAPGTVTEALVEVRRIHGGEVLPGFWRELAATPEVMLPAWAAVRGLGNVEAFDGVCGSLRASAEMAIGDAAGPDPTELALAPSAQADIARILAWFRAAVPAMIVEIEVVRGLVKVSRVAG